MSIRKGTTIIAGNSSPLDWTGTLQEYNIALENGTIKENMVCYITDDTLYTDDIRPEIDRLDNIKANKDLSNLSEVGEKHFVNKSQITNCITEIPYRTKYYLQNGTLILLAGTVIIVPYGTEDLTAQYPVGATFLHENFKVHDTQFKDGKFFVWAEIQNDINYGYTSGINTVRHLVVCVEQNILASPVWTESGTSSTVTNTYTAKYRTDLNKVHHYSTKDNADYTTCSLVIMKGTSVENGPVWNTVTFVYQGYNRIADCLFIDKGIKYLFAHGHNQDRSLTNFECTTKELEILDKSNGNTTSDGYLIAQYNETLQKVMHYFYWDRAVFQQDNMPEVEALLPYSAIIWHKPAFNRWLYLAINSTIPYNWQHTKVVVVGKLFRNGTTNIQEFVQTNDVIDLLKRSDKPYISSWSMPSNTSVNLTVGASGTEYIAPANGWLWFEGTTTGQAWFRLRGEGATFTTPYATTDGGVSGYIPARKGSKMSVYYGNIKNIYLKFYYAEGEI